MYEVIIENAGVSEVLHEMDVNSLRRAASGSFTGEINKIPSATFTVYPQNPCYEHLAEMQTTIAVRNTLTGEDEFEGRVLKISSSMSSNGVTAKSITCEGYLAYLCDSVQAYRAFQPVDVSEFLQEVLAYHNKQMPESKHIHLGSCDMHNLGEKITGYGKTLDEIKRILVDKIGGELRVRKTDGKLYLDYLQRLGVTCSTKVELAKNLQDLSVECDASKVITRLIPLGAKLNDETEERLTIAEINDGSIWLEDARAAEKYGLIYGTVTFDDCTSIAELRERGFAYLQQNNRMKKSYRGNALDLSVIGKDAENFREGNTYHFYQPYLGIDEQLRLIRRTVNIYTPYKPAVQIGDRLETLTTLASKTYNYIQYEAPKQKTDILAAAKATATALIKAGFNGYVVANENEILIMDAPDKATATKVWRWNAGGFGYSNTGYDGEYGTAITMDGAIVADFITAGVIRGIEIMNGDGTFHVDADGNCSVTDGTINCGNGAFIVNPDGSVTASKMSITGGSMKIYSNENDYAAVTLESSAYKTRIMPQGFSTDGSISGNSLILPGFRVADNTMTIGWENVYLTPVSAVDTLPQILRDLVNRVSALEQEG